jgi:hypothetical protein
MESRFLISLICYFCLAISQRRKYIILRKQQQQHVKRGILLAWSISIVEATNG